MVEVYVDTREPKDVLEWLCKLKVTSIPSKLDAGDYYVPGEKSFLFERKTATDFAKSISDKRIWMQLKNLNRSNADFKAVIVEGSIAQIPRFTKWRDSAIVAVLLTIRYKFDVDVFFTPNSRYTALLIYAAAKMVQGEKKVRLKSLVVNKKAETEDEAVLKIAEMLPGVGPATAVELLSHFGTLQNIANADFSQLVEVPRVGKKTARSIYDIFRHRFVRLE